MNSYPETYFLLWILAFLEKTSKKVLAPCPRPQNRGGVSINVVFWPARWPKIYYIFFLLAFLAVFLAGCATVTISPVLLSPSPSRSTLTQYPARVEGLGAVSYTHLRAHE